MEGQRYWASYRSSPEATLNVVLNQVREKYLNSTASEAMAMLDRIDMAIRQPLDVSEEGEFLDYWVNVSPAPDRPRVRTLRFLVRLSLAWGRWPRLFAKCYRVSV